MVRRRCQIATFGTMSSKAVIRDVGRVFGLPYSMCDRISKLIPHRPEQAGVAGRGAGAGAAAEGNDGGDGDGETIRELFDLAAAGSLTRNVGMHAGGVLIAPGKITDFCRSIRRPARCVAGVAVRQGRRRKRPAWSSSTSSACAT